MRREAEREAVDNDLDKKVDKVMDNDLEKDREERMMVATSAEKIIVLQKAIAGWLKPSGGSCY